MEIMEILVDHYKETCEIQRETIKTRNRLFVYIWIALFALYLLLISENEAMSAIKGWLKESFGIDASFSPTVILVLGWVLLLYFCMRYIQANVKIERDYKYINNLESEIKTKGCTVFSREGESYLDKYPLVLNYLDLLYKWFFPILIIIAVIIKAVLEIITHQSVIGLIIDMIIAIAVIVLWVTYLMFIRSTYN